MLMSYADVSWLKTLIIGQIRVAPYSFGLPRHVCDALTRILENVFPALSSVPPPRFFFFSLSGLPSSPRAVPAVPGWFVAEKAVAQNFATTANKHGTPIRPATRPASRGRNPCTPTATTHPATRRSRVPVSPQNTDTPEYSQLARRCAAHAHVLQTQGPGAALSRCSHCLGKCAAFSQAWDANYISVSPLRCCMTTALCILTDFLNVRKTFGHPLNGGCSVQSNQFSPIIIQL